MYVHNAGRPALYDMATVYVQVSDVNDNSPVFSVSQQSWTLHVPENARMSAVHTVEAYDADRGDNARISYTITGIYDCPPIAAHFSVAWSVICRLSVTFVLPA